jgi:Golgi nucleoside diphosphatase
MSITLIVDEKVSRVQQVAEDEFLLTLAETPWQVTIEEQPIVAQVTDEVIQTSVVEDTISQVFEVTREVEVPDFIKRVDEIAGSDPLITYIGKALPGTLTSEAKWQIQRITERSASGDDIDVDFAGFNTGEANAVFDKVWDDRLTYIYG